MTVKKKTTDKKIDVAECFASASITIRTKDDKGNKKVVLHKRG